jgi:primosomal protein N' (replication factor Y)
VGLHDHPTRTFGTAGPSGDLMQHLVGAFAGAQIAAADAVAAALARVAPAGDDVQVLGPAPAPLAMLRGQHRRRLLLKTARDRPVQPVLREWLGHVDVPARVRLRVDIDPYSFL